MTSFGASRASSSKAQFGGPYRLGRVRTLIKFMIESLKDLDEKMENKLNLMYGNYIEVIEHMKEKHGINGVYANTDYSPYAKVLFRPVSF